MRVSKWIEKYNKAFWYNGVFRFLFRNKPIALPLQINTIKRLLLIRRDMIGDMMITSSLIRTLHQLNPAMEIDVYASEQSKSVIEHNPKVSIIFSKKPFGKDFFREFRIAQSRKYDAIFCLSYTGTTTNGLLANIISPNAIKVGMLEPSRIELYQYWFNAQIDVGKSNSGSTQPLWKSLHQFIQHLFGIHFSENDIRQELFISEEEFKEGEQLLALHNLNEFILFNISARVDYRKWGFNKNCEFLKRIAERYEKKMFVVISSPNDREEAKKTVQSVARGNVILLNEVSFRVLCHVISKSSLIVSPDTSIVHIGATFQIPSVILCSQLSSGIEWQPLHTDFINVYPQHSDNVSDISPETVLLAFDQLITKHIPNFSYR